MNNVDNKAKIFSFLMNEENKKTIQKMANDTISLNSEMTSCKCEDMLVAYASELSAIMVILRVIAVEYGKENVISLIEKADGNYNYKEIFNRTFLDIELQGIFFDQDINSSYDIIDYFQKMQSINDKKVFGQYYTPIKIVDRILKNAQIDFIKLTNKRIMDPSCGAGMIYLKFIDELTNYYSPEDILKLSNELFYGIDINPNAIFLTKLTMIIHLSQKLSKGLSEVLYAVDFKDHFKVANTLLVENDIKYDYIIGNPPYFKIKNSAIIKRKYAQYICGQANTYGLFLVWANENLNKEGVTSFIIPQSIRNGEYFKKVRQLLLNVNVFSIECIDALDRSNIFENVEQAVMILTFGGKRTNKIKIILSNKKGAFRTLKFDRKSILTENGIVFPNSMTIVDIINKIKRITKKFSEIEKDITFGNGLFVWNQKKKYLRAKKEKNTFPIIYSNYINGTKFIFNDKLNLTDKGRLPFATIDENTNLILSCCRLIVKRTSSLEKFKRIHTTIITEEFIAQYKQYFVENHVNILYNKKNKDSTIDKNKLVYIQAYLNSSFANFWIKLFNGNTQISAKELNSLPYIIVEPDEIIDNWKIGNIDNIDSLIYDALGLDEHEIDLINNVKGEK